jgi:hypothetical protein
MSIYAGDGAGRGVMSSLNHVGDDDAESCW